LALLSQKSRKRLIQGTCALALLGACFLACSLLLPPAPFVRWNAEDAHPLIFSPDGSVLVTGVSFHYLQPDPLHIWDVNRGGERFVLKPSKMFRDVVLSSDGRLLAAKDGDDRIAVWDVATGAQRAELVLPAADDLTGGLDFSPDGRSLIFRCYQKSQGYASETLRCWDIDAKEVRWSLQAASSFLHFAPDGRRFALSYSAKKGSAIVQTWRVEQQSRSVAKETEREFVHDGAPWSPSFSPDLRLIAAERQRPGFDDVATVPVVEVLDVATGNTVSLWECPFKRHVYYHFSPDGRFVVVTAIRTSKQGDYEHQNTVFEADKPGAPVYCSVNQPVFSPDGRWLLTPDETGGALLDTETFGVRKVFRHPGDKNPELRPPVFDDGMPTFTFSPDSKTVAMTHYLMHEYTGSPVDEWRAGRFTFAGAKIDRPVARVWDVETGQELLEIPDCKRVLYSQDGQRLATVGDNGEISVWDLPPQRPWGTIVLAATGLWALSLFALWLIRVGVKWWFSQRRRPRVPEPAAVSPT
jgi:WD40 repeat protein